MSNFIGVLMECFIEGLDAKLDFLSVFAVGERQQNREGNSFNCHTKIFHMRGLVVVKLRLFLLLVTICKQVNKSLDFIKRGSTHL